MRTKKIAIYGGGGFGREVKMLIEQINTEREVYELIGFFDDSEEKDILINGSPILGGINELNDFPGELGIVLAIGSPAVKKTILKKITKENIFYPTLIHPGVLIGNNDVKIGSGTIICAGNIITVNIDIGEHVILNLGCTVGHDTIIHNLSSFMPGVNISGEVVINEGVYVGTGAKIINQLEVGQYTTIGAGALVSKSLPEFCTAVGVPAKPIKFHNL